MATPVATVAPQSGLNDDDNLFSDLSCDEFICMTLNRMLMLHWRGMYGYCFIWVFVASCTLRT
ncbi:hypothetical protein HanRHA438_Chr15g0688381 [Helianthus annuus]|uniref:Uncharacterized protein n=1 Tax=Helianthus annuus TaxID=4232 RepID=A0A251S613_HELAN|nr:hypothetical protein HanHA89_Chr15g0599621 [Helianthus annuus]KAJ0843165.1 hypothetical protein HanRHA438_Chr15g0688381 [Helianthus annuus]